MSSQFPKPNRSTESSSWLSSTARHAERSLNRGKLPSSWNENIHIWESCSNSETLLESSINIIHNKTHNYLVGMCSPMCSQFYLTGKTLRTEIEVWSTNSLSTSDTKTSNICCTINTFMFCRLHSTWRCSTRGRTACCIRSTRRTYKPTTWKTSS